LKNISSVVLNVKQPFARLVRWRIVAKGVRPVDKTLTLDRTGPELVRYLLAHV
jgi:hypothetical protein